MRGAAQQRSRSLEERDPSLTLAPSLVLWHATGVMSERIESFEEFWPFYVRQHSKKLTRQLHFVGTTLAVGCAALGLLTRRRWLLLAAPVAGYGPAWLSHFLVEKNRPATFSYPAWSLAADFIMWGKMLAGTMDDEVAAVLEVERARAAEVNVRTNMATDGTLN